MKKSKSHSPRRISEQVSIQTCLHADTRRQVPEGGKSKTDPQYRRNQPAMTCVLCHNQETYSSAAHGTGNSVKKRVYKPGPEVASFICSACVQRLLRIDQDQLNAAYALAKSRDFTLKAQALKSFTRRDDHEPKLSTVSRRPDRKRGVRVSRYHKSAA